MSITRTILALFLIFSATAGAVALGTTSTSGGELTPTPVEASTYENGHAEVAVVQSYADLNAPYDSKYHFVRVRYDGSGGDFGGFRRGRRGGGTWSHDYPRAERNFLQILKETTLLETQWQGSNVLTFDDPDLLKYPIAYIVEVGYWNPSDDEAKALGEYLLKGGFLIVDDTRGERGFEFQNFASHMERALPGLSIVALDHDHDIFDSFFRVDPLAVIPMYGPRDVQYYAIFEDNDPEKQMLAVFNFNNDIAEYWEYSDQGYTSIELTNEAFKLGVNYIVYAHTH
jgi:hypothetical protein